MTDTQVIESLPVKVNRKETPPIIMFLIIAVSLIIFTTATYVSLITYENSNISKQNSQILIANTKTLIANTKAIQAIVDGHTADVQKAADNAEASRKVIEKVDVYVVYFTAYMNNICKATPGCIALPLPENLTKP